MVAKKRKAKRKKGGGRKPDSGPKSSIKAQPALPFTDRRERLFHGQRDWRMICLRRMLEVIAKNDGKLPDDYLSARVATIRENGLPFLSPMDELSRGLVAEFEQAVLRGDAAWFRRQANVIEGKRKARYTMRGIFEWEVAPLLLQAADLNAKGYRITAKDIYNGLRKKKAETDEQPDGVEVEGLPFANRNRCIQDIRDLGKLFGLPLPDERGQHRQTKRARIAPTLNVRSAIERLRQTL